MTAHAAPLKLDARYKEDGLFIPSNSVRISQKRKDELVAEFNKAGLYISPSGFTARVIAEYCLLNSIEFRVTKFNKSNVTEAYYLVEKL